MASELERKTSTDRACFCTISLMHLRKARETLSCLRVHHQDAPEPVTQHSHPKIAIAQSSREVSEKADSVSFIVDNKLENRMYATVVPQAARLFLMPRASGWSRTKYSVDAQRCFTSLYEVVHKHKSAVSYSSWCSIRSLTASICNSNALAEHRRFRSEENT
jgi:hypothetical protein